MKKFKCSLDDAEVGAAAEIGLTIITATYNAAESLKNLVSSLKEQTDSQFEWVVADGGSSDSTLKLLNEAKTDLNVVISSQRDFGIYDALNRAVGVARGDYYIVVGADDSLCPDAIARYKAACAGSDCDMVVALVEIDGKVRQSRRRGQEWFRGHFAYVNGHAVSLLIKKSLHTKFGLYSREFPIAADQLFILNSVHGGAKIAYANFVAGHYSTSGVSGRAAFATLTEWCRVQVAIGHNLWPQLMLMVLRAIRHCDARGMRRISR